MGTVRLDPGAVSVRSATTGAPVEPGTVVVGSPPQWADGSDATYSTLAPSATLNLTDAPLPNLAANITDATLHLRASQATTASFISCGINDNPDPNLATVGGAFEVAFPSGGGLIEDFVLGLTDPVANIAAALASATPTLQFSISVVGSAVTIYEAWVEITTADTLLPGVRRHGINHLRQYPRSPLRNWPPEPSVQASNRRGGAYL